MIVTVRTDQGAEFARAEASRRAGRTQVHIKGVFFVKDDATLRDYVFTTILGEVRS